MVSSRAIDASVEEIKTWARAPWSGGVYPHLAEDVPIDHPDLEPIWAAANEEGLCVAHHSFTSGYPGCRDLWDNPFIGRTASHPWGAMRAVTAFFGAGIMDRYPNIRYCILESGFGWLPFWGARMDDQCVYMSYALPKNPARKPNEKTSLYYNLEGCAPVRVREAEADERSEKSRADVGTVLLLLRFEKC